jgi:hypothetical protein
MRLDPRFTITRRQLSAMISRLNRSRAGSPETGSFLENTSKLLQILAVVVGGAWVLNDYLEFKHKNNELTNKQLELSNETAKLTRANMELTNEISKVTLTNSTEGRVAATTDSSVFRIKQFPDQTALYKFHFAIHVKNLSKTDIAIPAVVAEVFLGKEVSDNIEPNKGFFVNEPLSSNSELMPTCDTIHDCTKQLKQLESQAIDWSRLTVVVQEGPAGTDDEDHDHIFKSLKRFPHEPGYFVGVLTPGRSADWVADYVLRAHSEDATAVVFTYWTRTQHDPLKYSVLSQYELLSEAKDAPSIKTQETLLDTSVNNSGANLGARDRDHLISSTRPGLPSEVRHDHPATPQR